jgi:hypothetical protein
MWYMIVNKEFRRGLMDAVFFGSLYHLDPTYTNVKKYTNTDGREVVWGVKHWTEKSEQINSELYRGTYNYAPNITTPFGIVNHYLFDMAPFDAQFGTSLLDSPKMKKAYEDANAAYNAQKRGKLP